MRPGEEAEGARHDQGRPPPVEPHEPVPRRARRFHHLDQGRLPVVAARVHQQPLGEVGEAHGEDISAVDELADLFEINQDAVFAVHLATSLATAAALR